MTTSLPFDWQYPRAVPGHSQKESGDRRAAELGRRVQAWNDEQPEAVKPPGTENRERAVGIFPHASGDQFTMWLERFTVDPDLMWQMVGNMVRFASSEETPRGTRLSGASRLKEQHHNLDAVHRMLTPTYAVESFPVAARALIGDRSLTDFAQRAHLHRRTLCRYLDGERPLTAEVMEAIAAAGRVDPTYFAEYRAMIVSQVVALALVERPNRSIGAIRAFRDKGR